LAGFAMDVPRVRQLIGRVNSDLDHLASLIRAVRNRRSLVPLLRRLGMDPIEDDGPAAAVRQEPELAGLHPRIVGRCPGWLAVLLESDADVAPDLLARVARVLRDRHAMVHLLLVFASPGYRRFQLVVFGLEGQMRQVQLDRREPCRTDLETLDEMLPRDGETGVALAVRFAAALDRSRITRQFFHDFKGFRNSVALSWTGIPADLAGERGQLSLLLLCRILFLYFLQRDGHLAGDSRFLSRQLANWVPVERATFYRERLQPLFFGALNTRPPLRDPSATWLHALPYLNGGLFERHHLERRFPQHDLPDSTTKLLFHDLFERYRFSSRELTTDGDTAIDPEMLGRVFEGLMAAELRGRTGTFFTPAKMVDKLVRRALVAHLIHTVGLNAEQAEALVRSGDTQSIPATVQTRVSDWLKGLRVLDPACGSGAFLLGALSRLEDLQSTLGNRADRGAAFHGGRACRREIVGRSLYGVDLQEDAALLCALRLWLALAVADESGDKARPLEPLPNLDRRIRQGDALLDPLELIDAGHLHLTHRYPTRPTEVLRLTRVLERLSHTYLTAGPEEKPALQSQIKEAERELARCWLTRVEMRGLGRIQELQAIATSVDLFGDLPASAAAAQARAEQVRHALGEIREIRQLLDEHKALPFFSFPVHFAEAAAEGFDLVLCNPPWVRAHGWPATLGRAARGRYELCQRPGWRGLSDILRTGRNAGAQVDLSLLFLERSIRLLRPGGILAILLPAKVFRSLYGAGARRMLLRETELIRLEDHSLHPRSLFQADAFPGAVIARKRLPWQDPGVVDVRSEQRTLAIRVVHRSRAPLDVAAEEDDLSLLPGDRESPWLLVPTEVRRALRRMQQAGQVLGKRYQPRRGVTTGANDVLLLREVDPKLSGLCRIRAEGYYKALRRGQPLGSARRYEAIIEQDMVRPLVRGSDLAPWTYRAGGFLLCPRSSGSRAVVLPPRTRQYLSRHASTLGWHAESGSQIRSPVSTWTDDPPSYRVAWRDIATKLEAALLPDSSASSTSPAPIPLNTVYFIAAESEQHGLLLTALLNSFPARVFTRAIAERAKDGRFRFFAWTLALLPLPLDWFTATSSSQAVDLAGVACRDGGIADSAAAELDRLACSAYGLRRSEYEALRKFDNWLSHTDET
jgi:SAM-dependent methyltransferase